MRTHQQVINEEPQPAFSLESGLRTADLLADAAALQQLMSREAEGEFDLARGPLLRVVLLDDEPAVLLLSACAACLDGASLMLLLDELCACYRGETLAAEPVQYADYAEWRHELISDVQEPGAQEGLAFWREDAADRPLPPRILFALPEGRDGTHIASAPLELHGIALEKLERAAVAAGVTAAVFLEAAWHALLARMSGASELLLAGLLDGRAQPDLLQALGAFEQPAPIRSRVQETTTFTEVLDQVRRARALAVRWGDCAGAEDLVTLLEQAAAGWAFHTICPAGAPGAQHPRAAYGPERRTTHARAPRERWGAHGRAPLRPARGLRGRCAGACGPLHNAPGQRPFRPLLAGRATGSARTGRA